MTVAHEPGVETGDLKRVRRQLAGEGVGAVAADAMTTGASE